MAARITFPPQHRARTRTNRRTIMPSQGCSCTSHPGITDYQGSSYFFHHNGALPAGGCRFTMNWWQFKT